MPFGTRSEPRPLLPDLKIETGQASSSLANLASPRREFVEASFAHIAPPTAYARWHASCTLKGWNLDR